MPGRWGCWANIWSKAFKSGNSSTCTPIPGNTSRKKCSVPPYNGPQYQTGRFAELHASNVVEMAAIPLAKNAAPSLSSHAARRCSAVSTVGLESRL